MQKSPLLSRLIIPLLFSILMISSFSYFANYNTIDIDYLELSTQLNNGNIETIAIDEMGHSSGTLREPYNGKKLFTSRIPSQVISSFVESAKSAKNSPKKVKFISNSGFLAWLPILLIILFFIFMMNRAGSQANRISLFGKSKAKLIKKEDKKVTFADVAGQTEAKEELQEIVEFLRNPRQFQSLGARIPKGVLLMGPPGTGKTLIARAVAGEANVQFFSISGSDFVEMLVGVGASRVRDLFDQGKKHAPCIIFIDELDAVGRHRGAGIGIGHDEREQTLNQLLVEMDGFESNDGVIIIAASNRPDILDPALLRPGRFDRKVVLDKPDIKGREDILGIHTRKVVLDEKVDLSIIARGTSGFSGADLANLVNEATLNAARHSRRTVSQNDLEFARDKVLMGSERKSVVMSDKDKRITAVHEAGHVIVAINCPEADPLHKVTIIPRGVALGLTSLLPEKDLYSYSKTRAQSELAILMGGRCAEEIVIKDITSGASNDIERATELARKMVCEWGMSKSIGLLKYGLSREHPFLGKNTGSDRNYSEQTAREIDQEIKNLVDSGYTLAKKIIEANRELLGRITKELLAKEVLTREDIKRISNES